LEIENQILCLLMIHLLFNYIIESTIWNVIAKVEAAETSPTRDEIVLIGNHRDAWVFGATDPNSGTAVMLEVARAFGTLLRQGWAPSRNILIW
jgi:N-acetylated-alpha-linked acidic dipeptidase